MKVLPNQGTIYNILWRNKLTGTTAVRVVTALSTLKLEISDLRFSKNLCVTQPFS